MMFTNFKNNVSIALERPVIFDFIIFTQIWQYEKG